MVELIPVGLRTCIMHAHYNGRYWKGNLMMYDWPQASHPFYERWLIHAFMISVGQTCGRGGAEDEEESRKRCCQEEKEGREIEEQAAKAARQIKKSLHSAVFIRQKGGVDHARN